MKEYFKSSSSKGSDKNYLFVDHPSDDSRIQSIDNEITRRAKNIEKN